MKTLEELYGYDYRGVEGRPRMSLLDRAAQFAPFAALTGFKEAIDDTGKVTESLLEGLQCYENED